MPDRDALPEPMTHLAEGAAQAHEMYLAYVNAGFTRGEALQLVIGILTAMIQKQPPQR